MRSRFVVWSLVAILIAVVAEAFTAEEIAAKGAEVLEEYRKERGHWYNLNDMHDVDKLAERVGKNGLAVAGFFVNPSHHHFGHADPNDYSAGSDPLYVKFKEMAQDQTWLKEIGGPHHKKWTFAFNHDRQLADAAGCEYGPDYPGRENWRHVCIIVTKTSEDGMYSHNFITTWAHEPANYEVKPTDISKFIKNSAATPVYEGMPDVQTEL